MTPLGCMRCDTFAKFRKFVHRPGHEGWKLHTHVCIKGKWVRDAMMRYWTPAVIKEKGETRVRDLLHAPPSALMDGSYLSSYVMGYYQFLNKDHCKSRRYISQDAKAEWWRHARIMFTDCGNHWDLYVSLRQAIAQYEQLWH